jgi:hypothetical protein
MEMLGQRAKQNSPDKTTTVAKGSRLHQLQNLLTEGGSVADQCLTR